MAFILFLFNIIELMTTFKYVNSGSYGCVITPGITADNKIDDNKNTVSKLFIDYESYKEELEIYEKIYNIVKKQYPNNYHEMMNKFTALILAKSMLNKKTKDKLLHYNIFLKCDNLKTAAQIHQLEYVHGGIDMENLFTSSSILQKIDIIKFLTNLLDLFIFVNLINNYGYVHADIKSANIVFDINTHFIRLIDFGLAMKKEEAYNYNHMEQLKDYILYPPEYIFTANYALKKNVYDIEYYFLSSEFIQLKNGILANTNLSPKIKHYFTKFFQNYIKHHNENQKSVKMISTLITDVKTLNTQSQINNFIENICSFKKTDDAKNITGKIDVFMLGSALLIIVLKLFFSRQVNITYLNNNPEIVENILHLLYRMLSPDPCKRISMKKALEWYTDIVKSLNKISSSSSFSSSLSSSKSSVKIVPPKVVEVKQVKQNDDLCKKWIKNKLVNPVTNYTIKYNGPTYNKLKKQCEDVIILGDDSSKIKSSNENNEIYSKKFKKNISKSVCIEWKKNKTTNPFTNRKIKEENAIYKEFKKLCSILADKEKPKK